MCKQTLLRGWRTGLEVLKCDPASLSFGNTLPRGIRTPIIESLRKGPWSSAHAPISGNGRCLQQLRAALRELAALERFALSGQDLQLAAAGAAPDSALQHSTSLPYLDIYMCKLTRLHDGVRLHSLKQAVVRVVHVDD